VAKRSSLTKSRLNRRMRFIGRYSAVFRNFVPPFP
jgi:hypothetical protein